ncbi:hypothetical protein ACP70R_009495 [Stipagrostis hirtigluma subsp. patula]
MANPSNLQVTPCMSLAECNELNFQGLYMYHTYSGGPKANQVTVVDNMSKGSIGTIAVNNWAIYDGPDPNAKVVAHAQGLHMHAGNWHNSFSLVFENERFSGSTLEVMGINVPSGEWAIVGGTGQFAMATGIISKRLHEERSDGQIIELTIHAFCRLLKGVRYPITKVGPWGGHGGSPQDITEPSKHLESITIHSGSVVDSIQFTYTDHAGQRHSAGPWGGPGGNPHTIHFASDEFVKEISGTIGTYEGLTIITTIKVVTNHQTFGPWGVANGTPFTVPVQPGSGVVGFFARGGKYLDALGVYLRPL